MLQYAVCEISGKQYKVIPGKPFNVDWQGRDVKKLDVNVLLVSEDGSLKLGKPFLSEKLTLESLGTEKGEKVRVAKFHAKANYRKVTGLRKRFTKFVLPAGKSTKKEKEVKV